MLRIEEARNPEVVRPLMRMAAAEVASTPISPTEVEVRAQVTLTAGLK